MKMIRTFLAGILALVLACAGASAATLLPNGEQQFFDNNGDPLNDGWVYFYVPNTLTPKNTWQDASQSTLNTNPVHLDSAGRAIIYGSGCYRQILKDSSFNTIWDQPTCDTASQTGTAWGGTAGGTANAITVTAPDFTSGNGQALVFIAAGTNTGATTINPNGAGAIAVLKGVPSGLSQLTGGEIVGGALVLVYYDGAQFQLVTDDNIVIGPLTNLASAATTNLGSIPSHNVNITGTTGITSFGSSAATDDPIYLLTFLTGLTITYNATSMILPGGRDLLTTAGSTAWAQYLGSGNWKVLSYTPLISSQPITPQGRLTLTTGVPVLVSDVAAATSVFYTPYVGNAVPLYNGTSYTLTTFSELTLTLNSSAQLADNNYDVFVADDAGTVRLCTGPAWTSATGRGTGAGTTQISYTAGFLANTVSITCKYSAASFTVAAGYGLYVGSLRTIANGQTNWTATPSPAAGGGNARMYLWNMYNRVQVVGRSQDSTDSWNYTTATVRAANAAVSSGTSNRISVLRGLNEDSDYVTYSVATSNATANSAVAAGICLDSTSAFATGSQPGIGNSTNAGMAAFGSGTTGSYNGYSGLGLHFYQACEYSQFVGTTTWYGDNGTPTLMQMTLQLVGRQ